MPAGDLQEPEPPAFQPAGTNDESAQRQLMERPQLSIRARIAIAFTVLFLIYGALTAVAVSFLARFETKIGFLEKAERYVFEIQQARRFEKNYFLYGTDLPDAVTSAHMAANYLQRDTEQIRSVVGEQKYLEMQESLGRYQGLLEGLLETDRGNGADEVWLRDTEVSLRRQGALLVADAEEMITEERRAVSTMLRESTLGTVGFLVLMFFLMFLLGGFFIRTILNPLSRFMSYVDRIGAGDYTPIRPMRRYRDEFSTLALAVNKMLTEIAARQEQYVQSGKMAAVGTLTSGIAHELNNPLNNLGLTIEALSDEFDSYTDDEKQRMLDQAYTQVERASATVRNLLDFTRKDESAHTSLSIRAPIESAVRLVSNEATIGGIEWKLNLAQPLPTVTGNPRGLQQVFLNLFLNAIQAMPDGGELSVSAHVGEDGFVRIDVSDTGTGIPAAEVDKIFDPFFTTKDPGEGTGLGLSVSRSIIQEHKGRISVHSEMGKGTTCSVFLPVNEEH
jgi:signal transduction histidine kinase